LRLGLGLGRSLMARIYGLEFVLVLWLGFLG